MFGSAAAAALGRCPAPRLGAAHALHWHRHPLVRQPVRGLHSEPVLPLGDRGDRAHHARRDRAVGGNPRPADRRVLHRHRHHAIAGGRDAGPLRAAAHDPGAVGVHGARGAGVRPFRSGAGADPGPGDDRRRLRRRVHGRAGGDLALGSARPVRRRVLGGAGDQRPGHAAFGDAVRRLRRDARLARRLSGVGGGDRGAGACGLRPGPRRAARPSLSPARARDPARRLRRRAPGAGAQADPRPLGGQLRQLFGEHHRPRPVGRALPCRRACARPHRPRQRAAGDVGRDHRRDPGAGPARPRLQHPQMADHGVHGGRGGLARGAGGGAGRGLVDRGPVVLRAGVRDRLYHPHLRPRARLFSRSHGRPGDDDDQFRQLHRGRADAGRERASGRRLPGCGRRGCRARSRLPPGLRFPRGDAGDRDVAVPAHA